MSDSNGKDLSDFSMLELFRMELDGQLESLNQGLLDLEKDNTSAEILEKLMRAAHSIKGAARMVNVGAVVRISHLMEDCFVALQKKDIVLNEEGADTLLAGADLIQQIMQSDDEKIQTWEEDNVSELDSIEHLLRQAQIGMLSQKNASTPTDMKESDEVEDSKSLTKEVEIQEELPAQPSTLRISVDRLDKILNLAGKSLIETHQLNALMPSFWQIKHKQQIILSELTQLQEAIPFSDDRQKLKEKVKAILSDMNNLRHEYSNCMAQLDTIDRRTSTISDHLHREIIASRMRPISDILNGLPRIVRDLSKKLKKEVRIQMTGLTTLVDKTVLERIDIPIKHIVQNAIDHGIESSSIREEKGKPKIATIQLHASMSAGMLFVVLEDDGAGVNYIKLKQSILRKKLATEDELENLDDMALLDFLFYAGFSTRKQVSNISGRGVGLDLVRDAVSSLNGSVHAASVTGQNMRFQLIMPLNISVLHVVLATINGESYAFPLSAIEQVYYAESSEIKLSGTFHYITINDEVVSLVSANTIFEGKIPRALPDQVSLIIVVCGDKKYGVMVEQIEGEEELSVNKLSSDLGKIRGINSVAILNSGSLTLIIDVEEYVHIIDLMYENSNGLSLSEEESLEMCEIINVLIVDDSMTVREMQKKVLSKLHYRISTANDGVDALEQLQKQQFDIVITDIDMPNMDGIRLANEIRFQSKLENLPVLIVSSREKAFVENSVILDEKTKFYAKDQFMPATFLKKVQKLVNLVVNRI